MSRRGWLWVIGVVLAVVIFGAAVLVPSRLLASSTASRLGLENAPSSDATRERLLWLDQWVDPIVEWLKAQGYASARLASAYRNDQVNAAVGGSEDSYHRHGLALDFSGLGPHAKIIEAAQKFRTAVLAGKFPGVRTILAEVDHLHVDWFDPTGGVKSTRSTLAANRENPGGSPRWLPL